MNGNAKDPGSSRRAAQSAETVVAVALLGVCVVVGVAAWLFSIGEPDRPQQMRAEQTASAAEGGPATIDPRTALSEWQQHLEDQVARHPVVPEPTEPPASRETPAPARTTREDARNDAETAKTTPVPLLPPVRQDVASPSTPIPVASPTPADEQKPTAPPTPAPVVVHARVDWGRCERPRYPTASVRRNEQGSVLMGFDVSVNGQPSNGRIVESSGFQRLDAAALSALSLCNFIPGTRDGVRQAAPAFVRFEWRLD